MNISTRSVLIDHRFLLAIIVVLVITLANYDKWFGPTAPVYSKSVSPTVVEEFRAAWIASVANINWPSQMGLSVDEQQQQAINLLDAISTANMGCLFIPNSHTIRVPRPSAAVTFGNRAQNRRNQVWRVRSLHLLPEAQELLERYEAVAVGVQGLEICEVSLVELEGGELTVATTTAASCSSFSMT